MCLKCDDPHCKGGTVSAANTVLAEQQLDPGIADVVIRRSYLVSVVEFYVDVSAEAIAPTFTSQTSAHERGFGSAEEARAAYFSASTALSNAGIVPGYQDVVDRWRELAKHGVLGHEQVELKIAGDQLLRALEHELGRR